MLRISTILILVSLAISFFSTLFLTKLWIRAARRFGLVGKDMNKVNGKEVAEAGGIAVLFGLLAGLFFYIFFKTFFLKSSENLIEILAAVAALLLAGFVGFIDDILGWKQGLRKWQKPLLTLPAAIPLMVTNTGHSTMSLPFVGSFNLGIIYPLFLVPIGVIGAANAYNMLAGLNGLEAGMGAIILSTMSIVAYQTGFNWLSVLLLIATISLGAFFVFNKYPAKVFPGDSLTYSIGALIAIGAIFGDMERIALFLFLPYIAEFFLKARYRFNTESFGLPNGNGTLTPPQKVSSLTHIYMKYFKTEKMTVLGLLGTELLLAAIVLVFYV